MRRQFWIFFRAAGFTHPVLWTICYDIIEWEYYGRDVDSTVEDIINLPSICDAQRLKGINLTHLWSKQWSLYLHSGEITRVCDGGGFEHHNINTFSGCAAGAIAKPILVIFWTKTMVRPSLCMPEEMRLEAALFATLLSRFSRRKAASSFSQKSKCTFYVGIVLIFIVIWRWCTSSMGYDVRFASDREVITVLWCVKIVAIASVLGIAEDRIWCVRNMLYNIYYVYI
jgi:hypothetical protein